MRKLSFLNVKFKNVILTAIVCMAFVITSCDKEITTTAYAIDQTKTGQLIIRAVANIDDTKAGKESVPDSVKVLVSVDNSDFLPGSATAITNTYAFVNGTVTLTLPVDDNGVTYHITPIEFTYNQIQKFNSKYQTINKLFTDGEQSITISTGDVESINISYNEENLLTFVEMVSISGLVQGDFDEESAGSSDTLSGAQTIIFMETDGIPV
ncbi:MAG: hypothetical protein HC896_15445 [Bacteroidales bacterium]|nr:hypothetical protein [Bacteroidales bacterium]